MANQKADPRFKRNALTVTVPQWMHDSLDAHSKMKKESKGVLVEQSLIAFLGLQAPERLKAK